MSIVSLKCVVETLVCDHSKEATTSAVFFSKWRLYFCRFIIHSCRDDNCILSNQILSVHLLLSVFCCVFTICFDMCIRVTHNFTTQQTSISIAHLSFVLI